MRREAVAPDILAALAELPLGERRKIMNSTILKRPTHPEPWLHACIRTYRERAAASTKHVRSGPPSKAQRTDAAVQSGTERKADGEPESPVARAGYGGPLPDVCHSGKR